MWSHNITINVINYSIVSKFKHATKYITKAVSFLLKIKAKSTAHFEIHVPTSCPVVMGSNIIFKPKCSKICLTLPIKGLI